MYLHRPDLLSLTFGILFVTVGVLALLGWDLLADAGLVLALLALAGGAGLIGSLATGDVHRQAAERRHRRMHTPTCPPAATATPDAPVLDDDVIDELFAPPIDPDELDRVYRETFGDEDPGQTSCAN
jgi:hypothetical protein